MACGPAVAGEARDIRVCHTTHLAHVGQGNQVGILVVLELVGAGECLVADVTGLVEAILLRVRHHG